MQSRLFLSSLFALSCAVLASGCGGSSSSFEGKEATCEEFCAELARCGSDRDAERCKQSCTEDEIVSRGGQEVITQCFAELSCETSNAIDALACLIDGLDELPRSGEAERFCEDGLPALSECGEGGDAPSSAECLDFIPLLSDELLEELNECLTEDRSCESKQRCVALEIIPKLDLDALQDPEGSSSGTLLGLILELFGSDGLTDFLPGPTPSPGPPPETDSGAAGAAGL